MVHVWLDSEGSNCPERPNNPHRKPLSLLFNSAQPIPRLFIAEIARPCAPTAQVPDAGTPCTWSRVCGDCSGYVGGVYPGGPRPGRLRLFSSYPLTSHYTHYRVCGDKAFKSLIACPSRSLFVRWPTPRRKRKLGASFTIEPPVRQALPGPPWVASRFRGPKMEPDGLPCRPPWSSKPAA